MSVVLENNNFVITRGSEVFRVPVDSVKPYLTNIQNELSVALKNTKYDNIFTQLPQQIKQTFTSNEAIDIVNKVAEGISTLPQNVEKTWQNLYDNARDEIRSDINRIAEYVNEKIETRINRVETTINWSFLLILLLILIVGWLVWRQGRI
jgi:CHASE3 domain sensor protein